MKWFNGLLIACILFTFLPLITGCSDGLTDLEVRQDMCQYLLNVASANLSQAKLDYVKFENDAKLKAECTNRLATERANLQQKIATENENRKNTWTGQIRIDPYGRQYYVNELTGADIEKTFTAAFNPSSKTIEALTKQLEWYDFCEQKQRDLTKYISDINHLLYSWIRNYERWTVTKSQDNCYLITGNSLGFSGEGLGDGEWYIYLAPVNREVYATATLSRAHLAEIKAKEACKEAGMQIISDKHQYNNTYRPMTYKSQTLCDILNKGFESYDNAKKNFR